METVLITGASGQLGRAISRKLLDQGYDVVGFDVKYCDELDPRLKFFKVDVTRKDSIHNAMSQLKDLDVTCLINNAGGAVFTPFESRSIDEINAVVSINVIAPILMTQEFIKYASNDWRASVINFGSIYGLMAPDDAIYSDTPRNSSEIYGMTKAANVNFTYYLSSYLKKYKIRSNCISPGGVHLNQGPEFIQKYSNKVPMRRMAHQNEISAAVYFLVDWKQSGYVNGHNLVIDGGMTVGV